jgi:hypothetical protein
MLVYADAGYGDGSADHIQLIHPLRPRALGAAV